MTKFSWMLAGLGVALVAMPSACSDSGSNPTGGTGGGRFTNSDTCNPVTGDGCTSGSTCDGDVGMAFECFGPPHAATLCGVCDPTMGNYCGPKTTCIAQNAQNLSGFPGVCYRWCCTDADCGPGGTCDNFVWERGFGALAADSMVGVCVQGSGTVPPPACHPPEEPPSGGSCIGGYHGGGAGGSGGGVDAGPG